MTNEFPKTEDELWSECIRIHSDIVRCREEGFKISKFEWLRFNGYAEGSIRNNCFFCQSCKYYCPKCPAALVETDFNCMDNSYGYAYYDGKFVTKLKELNKIRKATL